MIALIICAAGALIYLVCDSASGTAAKVVGELGRLAFFAGLLAYLLK